MEKAKTAVLPEGSAFTKHSTRGYTHRPGKFRKTLLNSYTFSITHLNNGQRATQPLEAYNDKHSKDEIWIFGCSFTYGWALNDEETYPWLIQKNLLCYKIVNFGVIGYGTVHSFIQFRETLEKRKKPKVAIIVYASFHDERNSHLRLRRKRWATATFDIAQPYARLNRDGNITYSMSEQFREFPFMRYSAFIHVLEKAYNRIEDRFCRSHEVSKAIIKEFSDLCKKNEIELIIAGIMPDSVTSDMLEYTRGEGILTIDISVDLNIPGNRNLPHDAHPSAIVNKQYAQKLESFLRSTVLGNPSQQN